MKTLKMVNMRRKWKREEVGLEQFHITRLIHPAFNIRVGHLIVPVGLTNSHHEPINFFGTSRPEGETTIIPLLGMRPDCLSLDLSVVAIVSSTIRQ